MVMTQNILCWPLVVLAGFVVANIRREVLNGHWHLFLQWIACIHVVLFSDFHCSHYKTHLHSVEEECGLGAGHILVFIRRRNRISNRLLERILLYAP